MRTRTPIWLIYGHIAIAKGKLGNNKAIVF